MWKGVGKVGVEIGSFVPFAKPHPVFNDSEIYRGMSLQSLEHPFGPIKYMWFYLLNRITAAFGPTEIFVTKFRVDKYYFCCSNLFQTTNRLQ
jgi:hypothetical protein